MYLFQQTTPIKYEENVQRFEIEYMNKVFVDLKKSNIDSEINFYKEFTKAIERKQFYIKGYLT